MTLSINQSIFLDAKHSSVKNNIASEENSENPEVCSGESARRGGECPIPGNIQGRVGWSSEGTIFLARLVVIRQGVMALN